MKNLRHLLRRVRPLSSRQASEDRSRGQRNSKRRLLSENLESRQLLAGDLGIASGEPAADVYQDVDNYSAAHNYWNAYDVDNSGEVTALDALRVINYLNATPEGEMTSESVEFVGFVDVNEDHAVTALDALMVINTLNSVGEAEDGDFTVEFEIAPRNLDDTLLPQSGTYTSVGGEQSPVFTAEQGDIFKIEVNVQDNRGRDAFGVFQSVVDIVVNQSGALAPAVGEIQGASLPRSILDNASASGTIEFFYEDDQANRVTATVGEFLGNNDSQTEAFIRDAIISLNPSVDSAEDIVVDAGTSSQTSPYSFRVNYDTPDLVLQDVPRLITRLVIGDVEQTVDIVEQNVFVNGALNSEVLVGRYETFMRNHPTRSGENNGLGPLVYGQNRNIGSFDSNVNGTDIFDEVGTLGPIGNLQNIIDPFDSDVAYDSFSIPVIALAPGNDITVRAELAPARSTGGTTAFEGVLIYGTEGGKEGVAADQVRFDQDAQFRLNISAAQTGITADNANLTVVEDDIDGETVQLVVNATATAETVTYAVVPNRTGALGTATIDAAGVFTYVPDANQFGTDVVEFTATNTSDGTANGFVTVTITPVNDPPTANDDPATGTLTAEVGGAPLLINVLSNDDAGGGNEPQSELTITLPTTGTGVVVPTLGTVTVVNDTQTGDRVQYTPNAGVASGTDTFTYTIEDTGGLTSTATVTVMVENNAEGVTAGDKSITINEDNSSVAGATTSEVLVADLGGADAGLITVNTGTGFTLNSATVTSGNGTARVDGTQIFYTPAQDDFGTAVVTYNASNTLGGDDGLINITITSVNDLPVAPTLDFTLNERSTRTLNVLQPGAGNTAPSDVETATANLTVSLPAQTIDSRGTVEVVNNQLVVTSTGAESLGDFSFQYRITDADGASTVGVVDIDVVDVQDAPVAGDQTEPAVIEGAQVITVDLSSLATVEGNVPLTFTVESQASIGTATVSGTDLLITLGPDENGANAQVVYRAAITSDLTSFDTGTVTFTVTPENDAPTLGPIADQSVQENSFVDIDVLAEASDPDNDTLSIEVVSQGTKGVASVVNGLLRYQTNTDELGADSIQVRVTDTSNAVSNTQTINIDITDVVLAPVASPGTLPAVEDGPDVTLDLAPLVNAQAGVVTFMITQPAQGSATLLNGVVTYSPDADFDGTTSLTYTATNALGSSTNTITIPITPTNDAPVAVNDSALTVRNTPVAITVLANDTPNPAGETDTITVTVEAGDLPSNGTVSIVNNVVTYTPNLDFSGTDSFTYTVDDGAGGTDTALVTVTVNDFETSTVRGQLFQDLNDNSSLDSDEIALGGIQVELRSPAGENVLGQLISVFTTTDIDGNFAFEDVPPGEYTIRYDLPLGISVGGAGASGAIPLTVVGGADGSPNASVLADLDITDMGTFSNGGRHIISTRPGEEGLASTITAGERSLFVYGDGPTESQSVFRVGEGFDGVRYVELALHSSRDQALLTIVNDDNSVETAVVDSSQLQISQDRTRVQLFGGMDDFNFVANVNDDAGDFPAYREAIDAILADL